MILQKSLFSSLSFKIGVCISLAARLYASELAELKFNPIAVGNEALLFVTHPEDENGNSVSGGGPRKEVIYVFNPNFHKTAQKLCSSVNPRPHPIARIDRERLLMSYKNQAFMLNITTGRVSGLLPGKEQTKVILFEDDKVYFLKRRVPYDYRGYTLGSENGKTVVEQYYQPIDQLYVKDTNKNDPPRLLRPKNIETVLAITKKDFFIITAGERHQLCKISKVGDLSEITDINNQWVLSKITHSFSPGKKLLALSAIHEKHDFHSERELAVIDLQKKKVVYNNPKAIKIDSLYYGNSSAQQLNLTWLNDGKLMYDSKVLDVNTGRSTDAHDFIQWASPLMKAGKIENVIGFNQFRDHNPYFKGRRNVGFFDQSFGLLYYKGEKETIASVLDEKGTSVCDLAVSAKGKWAAFCKPNESNIYFIDGEKKTKSILLKGWGYDIVWLPQAK